MPHAYMVAVGPAAAGTSSSVAVSWMRGSGPRPGRGGMLTARQESMPAGYLPAPGWPGGVGGGLVARSVGVSRAPAACSYAYASAISLGSLHAGPMKDSPTGSPKAPPAGTEMAGYPATAAGREVWKTSWSPRW